MAMSGMTAAARICRCCSKLRSIQRSTLRSTSLSTSATASKDEDEGNKMDALKMNPYFDKYSRKISVLQNTTPEEITRRINTFRSQKTSQQPAGQIPEKKLGQMSPYTKKKNLDDVVKLDHLIRKSTQEISDIWLGHHISVQDSVSVVISADVYDRILSTSLKHPTFLLPLPRHHGYEYFVSQSCGHEFHFTPLLNYQTFKENAPECLALTHFPELAEEKGIVLMQGEFNNEILNISEAMCLTNQLHRYYGEADVKRQKLLERFSNTPSEFHHMDLIVELERMVT